AGRARDHQIGNPGCLKKGRRTNDGDNECDKTHGGSNLRISHKRHVPNEAFCAMEGFVRLSSYYFDIHGSFNSVEILRLASLRLHWDSRFLPERGLSGQAMPQGSPA